MVCAFDTLGFSKRLREKGVPEEQADAHAEAFRDFVVAYIASKIDARSVKSDVPALKSDLKACSADLDAMLELQLLRLTVRWGAMLAIGFGALAAFLKLT